MDPIKKQFTGTGEEDAFAASYKKRLTEGGLAYSVGAVLIVLLSFFVAVIARAIGGSEVAGTDAFIYCVYLASQVALGTAVAIYFTRSRERVTAVFTRCKPRYFLIALLMQFGLLFSLSELNTLFIFLFERCGYQPSGASLPDLSGAKLLPAIFVIALLPALFEETLFRGILSRTMHARGWGLVPTLLISGALFSLYHGNPEQTVYQFLCGVCFSLISIRSGSVLPTMLAHFLNNAVILTLTSFGIGDLTVLGGGYVALVVCSAAVLAGTLVYLVFFDKTGNRRGKLLDSRPFFAAAAVGVAVCAAEWLEVLITGFLHA